MGTPFQLVFRCFLVLLIYLTEIKRWINYFLCACCILLFNTSQKSIGIWYETPHVLITDHDVFSFFRKHTGYVDIRMHAFCVGRQRWTTTPPQWPAERLSRVHAKSLTLDVGPIVRPVDGTLRYPSTPCHNATKTPTIRAPLGVNCEQFARLSTMAMLRVSSYRRLFEEQRWRQNGSSGAPRRTPSGRSVCADCGP